MRGDHLGHQPGRPARATSHARGRPAGAAARGRKARPSTPARGRRAPPHVIPGWDIFIFRGAAPPAPRRRTQVPRAPGGDALPEGGAPARPAARPTEPGGFPLGQRLPGVVARALRPPGGSRQRRRPRTSVLLGRRKDAGGGTRAKPSPSRGARPVSQDGARAQACSSDAPPDYFRRAREKRSVASGSAPLGQDAHSSNSSSSPGSRCAQAPRPYDPPPVAAPRVVVAPPPASPTVSGAGQPARRLPRPASLPWCAATRSCWPRPRPSSAPGRRWCPAWGR